MTVYSDNIGSTFPDRRIKMKRKNMKKVIAWALCLVMVLSCFTLAFAETGSQVVKAEGKSDIGSSQIGVADTDKVADDDPPEKDPEPPSATVTPDPAEGTEPAVGPEPAVPEKPPVDFYSFKDATGHWAAANLKKAVEDGLLNGFEDSTLRPDAQITLAQMVTIIVRILKPELTQYSGVPEGKWYTDAANKAAALGIMSSGDAANINSGMVRKQACAMVAEAFQLATADPDKSAASKYSDFASLTSGEKIIFASLVEGGFLQGYNGSLMLANKITRAEFVTILYRIADSYSTDSESSFATGTVLSEKDVVLDNAKIFGDLWLDATAETVELTKIAARNITVRSDSLESIKIKDSSIERLVLAARNGAVNLDCTGIKTTVVGSGGGKITLKPHGNNVEITGTGRNITISGNVGTVAVSGDYNTIIFENDADADAVIVNGKANSITLNSKASTFRMNGKQNVVKGDGVIGLLILYTGKSTISVTTVETDNRVDNGIDGMTVSLSGPQEAKLGEYLIVRAALSDAPETAKNVRITWTLNNEVVKDDTIALSEASSPQLNYYLSASGAIPDAYTVGLTFTYTTNEGETQVVKAQPLAIKPDKSSAQSQAAIVASIQTYYKGNRTTQWAIDHDYSKETKELFVNYKGYSSSSKYLIWVNIGTQHANVFQGSKGNWKLIRSGLVSTGAGDCTPRGVFKTTYKQSNWTTSTYTVAPVVRFYGGGYAMHSRLYQPGTRTLKGGNNGVGYPLSHGCVRMQADDITWIYNNVPDGTTVVVY